MTEPHTVVLTHPDVPPSLNRMGTRGAHWAVRAAKTRWETTLGLLLIEARLPRGLERVEASAVLRFPVRRRRDAGNFAWLLEKALGDALQPRWIPDDTPDRFQFHGVEFDTERGPAQTTVVLVGSRS